MDNIIFLNVNFRIKELRAQENVYFINDYKFYYLFL